MVRRKNVRIMDKPLEYSEFTEELIEWIENGEEKNIRPP